MRKLITSIILLLAATLTAGAQSTDLMWIDRTPTYPIGQSWGVPFEKGAISDKHTFTLTDRYGDIIPSQSWVMARWSDGSPKWVGFYATLTPSNSQGLSVTAVKPTAGKVQAASNGIVRSDDADAVVIDNGLYTISFPKSGNSLVGSIVMDGKTVASDGRLVLRTEDRSDADALLYKNFESRIGSVTVERAGQVAAVVKVEGTHSALDGSREWLPFTVRFYVWSGAAPIRVVHSFVFDGDQQTDFIKGLGIEFSLPFREELQNRHVAFAGEGRGIWDEASEPILTSVMKDIPRDQQPQGFGGFGSFVNYSALQFEGQRVLDYAEMGASSQKNMDNWAKWDDFRLVQLTSDGFTLQKRTGAHSSWVGTMGGRRARGFVLAGDVSGGIGISLKNFWQSFPAELDATSMRSDIGKVTAWMWSPAAEAMDLRHYDIEGHDLGSSYEDYVEGYSTPYGIARTSELTIIPYSEMPSREQISDLADLGQEILQVMVTPKDLHDSGAFGVWSLPDPNGNDTKRYLEKQIDTYLKFYQDNIETQRWYGFWNYGDVMHSVTQSRHTWNYDHGGRAWHNTELETDLWLWFGFIRSARPDFYRMATAMTRHTSEVDSYHIGRMKGLGSRHNVSHWGCGAKEARVGQAWWKRYYYYLFTDDRLGDLMSESVNADQSIIEFDPLLRAQPRNQFPTAQPTRLRWGPDWNALIGNWFTEWERTGERKWLDKINAGMNSLNGLPNGLFTGKGPYGYDPSTGVLTYEGDPDWITNSNHLANLQGGTEVLRDILDEVGNEEFTETYLDYASWYGVPRDDSSRTLPENEKYVNWYGNWNIQRLTAFAAVRRNDPHLAEIAWRRFLEGTIGADGQVVDRISPVMSKDTDTLVPTPEDARVSSNDTAQWNLEAIVLMELLKDSIPDLKDIEPVRSRF